LTQKRAKTVSQFLITKYGSLAAAIEAPTIELRRIVGLSEEGIAALRLPRVFAMRLLRERFDDRPIIGNWNSLYEYLLAMLGHKKSEHFRVLFLDNKKRLIADEHQADGCPVRVAVDTRKIMARALELHASGLILVHNHPSGDVTASEDDRMVTAEIVQAATMLRMRVYDHVIVGNGKCGSFKMDGLL